MITNIKVRALHNLYDYDILIPQDEFLTIITGDNGAGKTTLLKLVRNLVNVNFWYFFLIDFESISITFEDDKSKAVLSVSHCSSNEKIGEQTSDNPQDDYSRSLIFVFHTVDNKEYSFNLDSKYIKRLYHYFEDYNPRSFRANHHYLTFEEFLEHESDRIDISDYVEGSYFNNVVMFLRNQDINYLQQHRLLKDGTSFDSREFQIIDIARELKSLFQRVQSEYVSESLRTDTTFVNRLFSRNETDSISEDEYKKRIEALKNKLKDFNQYGLVPEYSIIDTYRVEYMKVLRQYLEDMESKLSKFDEFYRELSTLDKMIQGESEDKGLYNKVVDFNPEYGLCITDKNGLHVPLEYLSSGEQNWIILYYNLVFKMNSRTILLIDEPENSLHVAWQIHMVTDILNAIKIKHSQVIIATHSPSIINGRWDLVHNLTDFQ